MHRYVLLLPLLGLLLLRPAWATTYTYETVDVPFPGATNTAVTGLNDAGEAVGGYADANVNDQGFQRSPDGEFVTLLNVTPRGITNTGAVFGWYRTEGRTAGFVFQDGTLTTITGRIEPGASFPSILEVRGLNAHGLVVGTYRSSLDGSFHGFTFDLSTRIFTPIDPPGVQNPSLAGVNGPGTLVGAYDGPTPGTRVAFRLQGSTLTVVTIPDHPQVDLVGITDDDIVAGNAGDHGFIYDGETVQAIRFPGATVTQVAGIRNDGTVYGRYIDAAGVDHGFIATSDGSPPPPARKGHGRKGRR